MSEEQHNRERIQHQEVRFERRDFSLAAIVAVGLYLIATAILLHALLWLLFAAYSEAPSAPRLSPSYSYYHPATFPPGPRQEGLDPRDDPQVPRQSVEYLAQPYGWVSHESRVVRIPVALAMQVIAERQRGVASNSQAGRPAVRALPIREEQNR